VLRAAPVFVEYEPQSRIEGDVQQMPADFAVTEFWRVLAGQAPGRSVGAESDGVRLGRLRARGLLRAAPAARLRPVELGLGRSIDLVPEMDDPKNLFGAAACDARRAPCAATAPRRRRRPVPRAAAALAPERALDAGAAVTIARAGVGAGRTSPMITVHHLNNFALAAHPLAARGARPALRDQALPARREDDRSRRPSC
jgi:hypothetical protein